MTASTDITVSTKDMVTTIEITRPPHNFFDEARIDDVRAEVLADIRRIVSAALPDGSAKRSASAGSSGSEPRYSPAP